MRRFLIVVLVVVAGLFVWQRTRPEPESPPTPAVKPAATPKALPGAAIFKRPSLLGFKIELTREAMDDLRREPREYVPATVTIDGLTFTNVGVHLKGALGSFRRLDDRPALTLSFNKFAEGRQWFGLRKIHLNNSVQDRSYMNEYLASELFRSADVPTPRVAFATVELSNRKLGLYVLKEGFTQDFLSCFFPRTDGNLYEGDLQKDITAPLQLEGGKGVKDRSDLKLLAAAVNEPDPGKRWERLTKVLDVDRFISYLALEVMLADWDGYPLAPNNYRVYFDPAPAESTNSLAVFFPHGMDQLFQRAEMPLFPYFRGSVARAVIETPQGRQRYEERFATLFTNTFRFERMTNTMGRLADLLRPVQPEIDDTMRRLRAQVANRIAFLERQPLLESRLPRPASGVRATPWPQAPTAAGNRPGAGPIAAQPIIRLADWRKETQGDAALEQVLSEGRGALQITARGPTTASWQTTVRLKAGRYRLEGRARTTGVEALGDAVGEGAGLRITGTKQPRLNKLVGTTRWTMLAYEFEVAAGERDVTCVCELRARSGMAQFDLNSLRLVPQGR